MVIVKESETESHSKTEREKEANGKSGKLGKDQRKSVKKSARGGKLRCRKENTMENWLKTQGKIIRRKKKCASRRNERKTRKIKNPRKQNKKKMH